MIKNESESIVQVFVNISCKAVKLWEQTDTWNEIISKILYLFQNSLHK